MHRYYIKKDNFILGYAKGKKKAFDFITLLINNSKEIYSHSWIKDGCSIITTNGMKNIYLIERAYD